MRVWQPSLEEVSLDYSNHPNVRMNECRGGVYSAAAHFSSTWHKAPALFHPLSLSISVSPSPRTVQTKEAEELQNSQWPTRMSSHTNAKSLKVAYSSPKLIHIFPSSKLVWPFFLKWKKASKRIMCCFPSLLNSYNITGPAYTGSFHAFILIG